MSAAREFIRVPVAMLEACSDSPPELSEREAVQELCGRFWYGDKPSRTGLEKGQTRAPLGQLADAWGWPRQRVRHFLAKLSREGQIATKSEGRCTLISCAQLAHNLRTTRAQAAHNPNEEKQTLAERERTTRAQTPHNPRTTCARNQERDRETERQREEIKRTKEQEINSLPTVESLSGGPDTSAGVEPVRHDLTTKAGRSRHWPEQSKLPTKQVAKKDGGTRTVTDWPDGFARFRAAYPKGKCEDTGKSQNRCPPGAYKDWRYLVVAMGVDPDDLVRAATAYGRTAWARQGRVRRCHGPSGWLRQGEYEEFIGAAEPEPPAPSGDSTPTAADWDDVEFLDPEEERRRFKEQFGLDMTPSISGPVTLPDHIDPEIPF